MKYIPITLAHKSKFSLVASIATVLLTSQSGFAAVGDKVHAFYADEHNTSPTSNTGNRILEIDIENMSLVNSLDVPGNLGHHADNGFNSKIYGVPKGSNYVNVIDLSKDVNNTTLMNNTKQIQLIHKPRSGDAFNKKFNVILMAAANRPMGSFINVETDEVVGTIGENADCTLTDGTQLLSHADANTNTGALKYHCATPSHGGTQVSGHPYWLTPDYAAIVDRSNKRISTYKVTQDASTGKLTSTLVNHLPTRTSIHQIVPRDRTSLPTAQQADFYAVEEGEHVSNAVNGRGATDADYVVGVSHALIHLQLTSNGLQFIRRLNLQRTRPQSKVKSDRILDQCIANYRGQNRGGLSRAARYEQIFTTEGLTRNPDQDANADFPTECFFPGIPGGHNADFAPNNKHVYVPMAGGALSIIDVNRWKIVNNVDIGIASGPGHVCFSAKHNLALVTNHGKGYTRVIRNINSARPSISQYLPLGFANAGLTSTKQSHTCYIDEAEEYYYNFFTDGGVFYKMNLAAIAANTQNGNPNLVTDSLVTGGIPIQGSYIKVKDIKSNVVAPVVANNDTATVSNVSVVNIPVLDNDTGPNLIVEYAAGESHGTVSVSADKHSVRYTPNTGFRGTDDFWYAISSNGSDWKWANVVVTVNGSGNQNPLVANNDTGITTSGNSVTVDVIANDTGDSLTLTTVGTAWNGVVTHSGNSITYTAPAGFVGTADIWYEVTDVYGNEEWARLDLTVNSSQGFQANDDAATVKQGQSVTVNVLDNDTGNGLRLTVVDTGWEGVTTSTSTAITYTAPSGSAGDHVGIWYEVTDASGNEDWAQLVIQITN